MISKTIEDFQARSPLFRSIIVEAGFALRSHSLIITLMLIYVVVAILMSSLVPTAPQRPGGLMNAIYTLAMETGISGVAAFSIYGLHVRYNRRPPVLAEYLMAALRERFFTIPRMIAGAIVMALLIPFIMTFSSMKSMVPLFGGYTWDVTLWRIDRAVHFGNDPWQLLQPVLGHPIVTFLLSSIYNLWFAVIYGALLWQAFGTDRPWLRMRFLTTTVLIWPVLGNLAAVLMASAGPVYYGRIAMSADVYAPLVHYLYAADRQLPILALRMQEMLWRSHTGLQPGFGEGISAMPSLHVATAFTVFLLCRAISRTWGWISGAFCVAVLIASVHLAWHYAVDGYVGILGATLIWWFTGWLLRRPVMVQLLWAGKLPDA